MALPSSRRPEMVEEELKVDLGKPKKLKLNRNQVFMDMMIEWYKFLSNPQRNKLTGKKLKKKAVQILYELNYNYDNLPKDWVAKLAAAAGMKLYARKKKDKEITFLEDVSVVSRLSVPGSSTSGSGQGTLDAKAKTKTNDTKKDKTEGGKEFIDLTQEPPPPEWLEAYINGVHLRRELTIFSGQDKTIAFYDYDPRYKDMDIGGVNQLQYRVHDANSFRWFVDSLPENAMGKKKEDVDV